VHASPSLVDSRVRSEAARTNERFQERRLSLFSKPDLNVTTKVERMDRKGLTRRIVRIGGEINYNSTDVESKESRESSRHRAQRENIPRETFPLRVGNSRNSRNSRAQAPTDVTRTRLRVLLDAPPNYHRQFAPVYTVDGGFIDAEVPGASNERDFCSGGSLETLPCRRWKTMFCEVWGRRGC